MIRRGEFIQTENLALWSVTFKKGQSEGRALAAYDEQGNSLDWERSWYQEGKLYVDFGVDSHIGKLKYEYVTSESQDAINGTGGVINVNINQYNGGLADDPIVFQ